MWPTTRHSAYPFLNSGIKGFIGLPEQLQQALVVLIDVEDQRLTIGQDKEMNTDKILKYPARGGVSRGFAGLMGKGVSVRLQALPNTLFQTG